MNIWKQQQNSRQEERKKQSHTQANQTKVLEQQQNHSGQREKEYQSGKYPKPNHKQTNKQMSLPQII